MLLVLGLMPHWLCLGLLLGIALSALFTWRNASQSLQLVWLSDQGFELRSGDAEAQRCVLLKDSRVWSRLVILHLAGEGGERRWLSIWPDQLSAVQFRHLRVRLTLDGAAASKAVPRQ